MDENPTDLAPADKTPLTARLREAVLNSISYKGGLRTLRIFLDISESSLNNFLKKKTLPNSETTMRLLEWIKLAQSNSLPVYPKEYAISEKQRAAHELAKLRKAKRQRELRAMKKKDREKKQRARRPRKKPTILPPPPEVIDRDRTRKIIEALEAQAQRNRFQDRFKRLGLAA